MPQVLLSFRRSDSIGITARIFDRLTAHYGSDSVFRDLDSVPPGLDFRSHVKEVVRNSNLMLVVVGPEWLATRSDGSSALDNENDPIRIELETAYQSRLQVIPILVEGAIMPRAHDLPDSIKNFSYHNAMAISSDLDFDYHIERLIRTIDKYSEMSAFERSLTARSTDAIEKAHVRAPEAC